jgi:small subunit ribosomal protein S17e
VGQVRTLHIKNLAKTFVEKYPDRFTKNFEKNKEELDKIVQLESKKIRNEVAGYIVNVIKMQSKPKGMEVTFRPKEDRRRGRGRRRRRK